MGELFPGQIVFRLKGVKFYSLTSAKYDPQEQLQSSQYVSQNEPLVSPCLQFESYLSSGRFYWSNTYDITHCIASRYSLCLAYLRVKNGLEDDSDMRFLWNGFMISDLLEFRAGLPVEERQKIDHSGILVILSTYISCV